MLMLKVVLGVILLEIFFHVFFLMKSRSINEKKKRIRNKILSRIQRKTGETFFKIDGTTEWEFEVEVCEKKIYGGVVGDFIKEVKFPVLKIGKMVKTVYNEFGDFAGYDVEWEKKYTKEGVEISKETGYQGISWDNI